MRRLCRGSKSPQMDKNSAGLKGWNMPHTVRKATADDAGALARLAEVTFPLACPPSASPEDISAHLANTLSERHFQAYLADPDVTVLVIDAEVGRQQPERPCHPLL